MSSSTTYHSTTIWAHWLSALLIFGLIYTGITMEHLEVSKTKFLLYQLHFICGGLVLVITLVRLYALMKHHSPTNLYPKNSFRERFRQIIYSGFYIVLLWMSFSGMFSLFSEDIFPALLSREWSDLPSIAADGFHPVMLSHHIVAKLVFLLIILHLGGFLLHLIQKKENTLGRIWFKKEASSSTTNDLQTR